MEQHILVPLDGSAEAEQILPHAIELARITGAGLRLGRVVPASRGEQVVSRHDGDESISLLSLTRCAARLRGEGIAVEVVLAEGVPAPAILAAARQGSGCSHIAMATHGRKGLRRLIFGSVAERVVRESPVPVLLAHCQEEPPLSEPSIRTILVPLDTSQFAEQALDEARTLAHATGATVVLVSVVETTPDEVPDLTDSAPHTTGPLPSWTLADRATEEGYVKSYLARQAQYLSRAGIATRTEVAYGPAADAILRVANEQRTDLLCMASHGSGGMERFWAGSVALRLVKETVLPVLLLGPGRRQARARSAPVRQTMPVDAGVR